jgi:protein-S-isoprenylcysteine O-methyltransferase
MLKVWFKAFLMSTAGILGPGIFVPALWCGWQIWWLFAGVAVLLGSQPNVKYSKLGIDPREMRDRNTILAIVVAGYASVLLPLVKFIWAAHAWGVPHASRTVVIAAAVGAMGLVFRVYSIRILGKFFTAHVVIQEGHRLCEEGPYRWIRHPSYTGSMAFFCMVPVVLGYPLWFFLYVPAWLLVYRRRIAAEEAALGEHFGEKYAHYKARTKALIPHLY